MSPAEALRDVRRLLLDTAPVIYLVEKYPDDAHWTARHQKAWAVLRQAAAQKTEVLVSPLTLSEVLSKPSAGQALIAEYQAFCLLNESLTFVPFTYDDVFAYRVANLGRAIRLRLPDRVQVAYAELEMCEAILTNDKDFATRSPVRGLLLDEIDPP